MNFIQFEKSNYFYKESDNLILVTPNTVTNPQSSDVTNSFSPTNTICNTIDLMDEVMKYASSVKLQTQVKNDIEALLISKGLNAQADVLTQRIIDKVQKDKANSESYILANYSHLEDEGALLYVYSSNAETFSINFVLESSKFGSIA